MIHQFDTHPNREASKADLEKDHAFNPFSEKSKDMISSMENTEYFEMCEITSKEQCHNCLKYWTTGIVFCNCGTCLRPSDKNRKLNKDRLMSETNGEARNLLRSSQHNKEGKETWLQNHVGQILEQTALSKITTSYRMGRIIMRPLRRDCSRRSLLDRDNGRAEQK